MRRAEDLRSLRDKTDDELLAELSRARQDLFQFRTDVAMRSLANVRSIRSSKKRIARILTLARERELGKTLGGPAGVKPQAGEVKA